MSKSKIYTVDQTDFMVSENVSAIREAQGILNFKKLYEGKLIQVTQSLVTMIYTRCRIDGVEAIFIGQQ